MTRKTTRTVLSLSALALLITGAMLHAGPLSPPAGPVAPTLKTLTEVEPRIAINAANTPGDADSLFKITQPGSYYLTGNITGVVGKHGIEITASGVTLDLNGFDLLGVQGIGNFDGVSVTVSDLLNITVRNGSIRGWADAGVDLGSNDAFNSRVQDLLARGNNGIGIHLGTASSAVNCSASENGSIGISVGGTGKLSNCLAFNNIDKGFRCLSGSTVTDCSAYFNLLGGFSCGSNCIVANCSSSTNEGNGIFVDGGSTVTNCTATSNTLSGIVTSGGCIVSRCTARRNDLDGIRVLTTSRVEGSVSESNTRDGIQCSSRCIILSNSCSLNGDNGDGAGIHATGSDNRIESNHCADSDRGIDIDGAGNLIIRNSCTGNTINWAIAANNVFGAIIDRTAVVSGEVIGNSASATTGSSDSNANFTY
jgi:parallel beta-helix repeat protein